jgi:hypothetical protein
MFIFQLPIQSRQGRDEYRDLVYDMAPNHQRNKYQKYNISLIFNSSKTFPTTILL